MKSGVRRRHEILTVLDRAKGPVSATKLAQQFGVSRQVIVGDIALLRAENEPILATARGYLRTPGYQEYPIKALLAVRHQPEQTETELTILIGCGCLVENVMVTHPLYGELSGNLNLRTMEDVRDFLERMQQEGASLLSALTDGVHLHQVRCRNKTALAEAKKQLKDAGILLNKR